MKKTPGDIIYQYLRTNGTKEDPIPTTKISTLFPNQSRTVVNYHLRNLLASGKIKKHKFASPAGSALWYVHSSRKDKTLVFDINGKEKTWSQIMSVLAPLTDNPFIWDIVTSMDYIASLNPVDHKRDGMVDGVLKSRKALTDVKTDLEFLLSVITSLLTDDSVSDVDVLSQLKLERYTNGQK